MQYLANILDAPVDRPTVLETTALGAAWLAGQYAGLWDNKEKFANSWRLDKQFQSNMDDNTRKTKLTAWDKAVKRALL